MSMNTTTPNQEKPASPSGRYLLKRFHAKGGVGEIWVAEDPRIGRSVALKRMLGDRPDQRHRFLVEAQVTGQLEHPGIVPIHEVGIDEAGKPFYVMKFVRGKTFQSVIDEFHVAKLTPDVQEIEQFKLLQSFLSLCQTVAYAHSRGVIHRDLKPENVMVGDYGETLLLNWDIAKVVGNAEANAWESELVKLLDTGKDTETRGGAIMGSLTYMSPEAASGKNNELDARSDIFLLGGILFTILTGRPPRQGTNAMELIKRAQKEQPPSPRKYRPEAPRALEAICVKAMALRPEDRYQTAKALAEDLQRYQAGEPVSAYRENVFERAWRWAKRHRTALTRTAAALLFLSLIAVSVYFYWEMQRRLPPP
jgi:serine/threonine-protein kinase